MPPRRRVMTAERMRWYADAFETCSLDGDRAVIAAPNIHTDDAMARAKALNAEAEAAGQGDAGATQAREGTVAWLIREWVASPSWAALSPATRKYYAATFRAIEEWCGAVPPRAVTRKAIKAWQRSLIENRSQAVANLVLTRLHKLMEMARDEGLIEVNPASRLGLVKVGGNREPWSKEEIDAVRAKAVELGRPSIALAVLLAANLGQREADILKLPRSRYDAATGMFDIVQQKTGRRVGIPATLELRAALDAAYLLAVHVFHFHDVEHGA